VTGFRNWVRVMPRYTHAWRFWSGVRNALRAGAAAGRARRARREALGDELELQAAIFRSWEKKDDDGPGGKAVAGSSSS
jgi:hypothetical protein